MIKKCKCSHLEEIHGFNSLSEYELFLEYLNKQIKENNITEIPTDKNYEKGLIYGGKWFKCNGCNEIWRIVPPDFPFKGLWEKVTL